MERKLTFAGAGCGFPGCNLLGIGELACEVTDFVYITRIANARRNDWVAESWTDLEGDPGVKKAGNLGQPSAADHTSERGTPKELGFVHGNIKRGVLLQL